MLSGHSSSSWLRAFMTFYTGAQPCCFRSVSLVLPFAATATIRAPTPSHNEPSENQVQSHPKPLRESQYNNQHQYLSRQPKGSISLWRNQHTRSTTTNNGSNRPWNGLAVTSFAGVPLVDPFTRGLTMPHSWSRVCEDSDVHKDDC